MGIPWYETGISS